MAIVGARGRELRQRRLQGQRVRQVGGLLECEQSVDQAPARGDRADARTREERLREREEVEHETAVVESGERRRRAAREAQVRLVAVLDDGLSVARGDLEQLAAVLDRGRRAERVVKGRDRVEDLDFRP